jgi:hypothetical protein
VASVTYSRPRTAPVLTDISGNRPDIASDALVQEDGQLALATDSGAYTARAGEGSNTRWYRLAPVSRTRR